MLKLRNAADDKTESGGKCAADDTTTLQILKDHGISMQDDTDSTLLNSALQSGRKLVLSDAGKMILNDPKFRKNIPLVRAAATSTAAVQNAPPPPPLTFNNATAQPSNTIRFDQLRKQKPPPIILQQPGGGGGIVTTAANKGMPLKTNKVIKILSAEEFKQMCGANASGSTLKKISAESFHNGQLK